MKEGSILPLERILTAEESNSIKEAILKAINTFELWGYNYIKLPAFEHYEAQERSLGEKVKDVIVIKDIESKELVSLRADFTAQVVRSVSFLKPPYFPQRLYYFGTLFFADKKTNESFQVGLELIGVKEIEGDAEVISALYEYIKSLGIKDAVVSVGHVNIVGKIIRSLPEHDREEARKAFKERNISFLKDTFGNTQIPLLPFIQDRESALRTLSELGMDEERKQLEKLGDLLTRSGVKYIYDLSEVRELPYYTGVVFEIYHPQIGSPIAGGGRYDGLSRLYGEDFCATGGSVYIDACLSILENRKSEKDFFIVELSTEKNFAPRLAEILRGKGYKVGLELTQRNLEHSLSYAFWEGYKKVLVLYDKRSVRLYTTVKECETMSLKEFLELF